MLSKSGHIDLSFNEIYQSSGLAEWEEWMYAKVMKTDEKYLVKLFEKVFTNYLNGLMSSIMVIKATVMTEIWCHPGKTGIIGLLLCFYWQAKYSGSENECTANIKHIEYIFNSILVEPNM